MTTGYIYETAQKKTIAMYFFINWHSESSAIPVQEKQQNQKMACGMSIVIKSMVGKVTKNTSNFCDKIQLLRLQ